MSKRVSLLFILLLAVAPLWAAAGSAPLLKARADSLMNSGQYSPALETYLQALKEAENSGNRQLFVACIGNIANIYAISGEYERSVHYNRMGYDAARQLADSDLMGKFLINSVGLYCALSDLPKAREQLTLMEQHPLSDTLLWHYYTMHYGGLVARLDHDHERAQLLCQQALDYVRRHRMGSRYELSQLSEMASLLMQSGQKQEAMVCLRRHLAMTDSIGSSEQQAESCRLLAEAYEKMGVKDTAMFYMGMYHTLRDSAIDQRQLAAAKEKLYQYESSLSEGQITQLNQQVNRQWWLLAALAILAIISVIIVSALRKAPKAPLSPPEGGTIHHTPDNTPASKTIEAPSGAVGGASPSGAVGGALEGADRAAIYLSPEQVAELAQRIDKAMSDVQVISDPDFSLQALANRLESNTKYVSYTINQVHGKTFKMLLNERRIEEAARRLADHEHYGNITIQGIYQELGYNSAAAFIQAFKKIKGTTPSQYQKNA